MIFRIEGGFDAAPESIAAGGAYGTIMGRNSFQRPRDEALKLLSSVMEIYRKAG